VQSGRLLAGVGSRCVPMAALAYLGASHSAHIKVYIGGPLVPGKMGRLDSLPAFAPTRGQRPADFHTLVTVLGSSAHGLKLIAGQSLANSLLCCGVPPSRRD